MKQKVFFSQTLGRSMILLETLRSVIEIYPSQGAIYTCKAIAYHLHLIGVLHVSYMHLPSKITQIFHLQLTSRYLHRYIFRFRIYSVKNFILPMKRSPLRYFGLLSGLRKRTYSCCNISPPLTGSKLHL